MPHKKWLYLLLTLILLTACQSVEQQRCLALIPTTDAFNLSQYQLVINQKELPDIQNLSGLTGFVAQIKIRQ